MARRSQCSSAGDNPLDPNYLPPHYREEYRLAIDALVEEDLEGYFEFLQRADVVDFLSTPEIQYIQSAIQVPKHSSHPEYPFVETVGDGSSDTYWPIHSDLEAPGLDLGWPQLHHFGGPTEVTTLVNPPEPDMPSIKEQARRLIKNAQQVIAIVMDMFTDVDMFADILNAAMRNVAVYIILDEQNVHHFINMVTNCRVNLQSIQFLRVRTVCGITYHCRSGKTFKGQMMDRFLLTDCRAVLSGNYSFMWSFEKLHRCMAHLFLGQLVSTFDEEFRILYAQSQPLMMENALAPVEDFGLLQKKPYPSKRTSLYREPRKFLSLDTAHPDEWVRHSYDERMESDWRRMPLKRHEPVHGPLEIYSRIPSQQSRIDPPFDQGPSRLPVTDNPAFKRHSYAEGGHGRYPMLQQQGLPDLEAGGRQFHRGQQPNVGPGPEADYHGYDKFWSQDYHSGDVYSEPGLPQEMELSDNFDPVLNYLSSTRNIDFDQSSEKSHPAADLPFSLSHPTRLSAGQAYACQTSPTPSNPTDEKQFLQEPNTDRKDPMVKRGLRNWRISSYLSAYDNPEDEGLPPALPQAADPFEAPSNPIQQTAPGLDLSVPKIPNVREFKVPAIPRASQMPSYAKATVREQSKKLLEESTAVPADTKTTPTPSESSSTTEADKPEEAEQKEPKTAFARREESFRRKYNAAIPRSSRLRSSLIFSSLEQQNSQDSKTASGQQDEENDKNESEQTKLGFVSQVLGQRRSSAREPFEWSRYIKSATFDSSVAETSKLDDRSKTEDKDSSKEENAKNASKNNEVQESLKLTDVEHDNTSPATPRSNLPEAQPAKTQPAQPPKLLPSSPYYDMSDPDNRLMFFKELAAKRKAAKAEEAESSTEKAERKAPADLQDNVTVKKEEAQPKETSEKKADASARKPNASSEGLTKNVTAVDADITKSSEVSLEVNKQANRPSTLQSSETQQSRVSTDSEKMEWRSSQSAASLPVSIETEPQGSDPAEKPKPAVTECSPSQPPTTTKGTPSEAPSPELGIASQSPTLDSTSEESSSLVQSSASHNLESFQLEASISSPPSTPSEFNTGTQRAKSEFSSAQSSSCHSSLSNSSPQITTGSIATCYDPEDSSTTPTSSNFSLNPDKTNPRECINPSPPASTESAEEMPQKSSSDMQTGPEISRAQSHSFSHSPSLRTPSAVDSVDHERFATEGDKSALPPDTNSEEPCLLLPDSQKIESSNSSDENPVAENSGVSYSGSPQDVKADGMPASLSLSSHESCSASICDLGSSNSKLDGKEPSAHAATPADPPPEHPQSESSVLVSPDITQNACQSVASPQVASPQVVSREESPSLELNLTGSGTPTPTETLSCSPALSELLGSVMFPQAKKAEANLSASHTSSDTELITQTPTDSDSAPTEKSATREPLASTLKSDASESYASNSPEPADKGNTRDQIDASKEAKLPEPGEDKTQASEAINEVSKSTTLEATNDQVGQNSGTELAEVTADEAIPASPQSKQPKSSQSRYHSSTANVLSSSNLRDDTKLLLEQISANSQTRNESAKEPPVTDDEKEDEADKNAKREKERGIASLSKGQPKSTEEREKLLERIQSMRKERKVYSRFEMAP